jgi:hypothetical protein
MALACILALLSVQTEGFLAGCTESANASGLLCFLFCAPYGTGLVGTVNVKSCATFVALFCGGATLSVEDGVANGITTPCKRAFRPPRCRADCLISPAPRRVYSADLRRPADAEGDTYLDHCTWHDGRLSAARVHADNCAAHGRERGAFCALEVDRAGLFVAARRGAGYQRTSYRLRNARSFPCQLCFSALSIQFASFI